MKKLTQGLGVFLAIAALFVAPIANAAEFIGPADDQGNVSLPSSETHRNLYVAGGTVSVASLTQGDLFVAGGNVVIEGNVEEDLFVGGGNVTVNGTVGGDIRAASGNLLINNTVGGDVLVAGGTVRIAEKASINGDFTSAAGEMVVDGSVRGNVKVTGGVVTLNGEVNGQSVKVQADESFTLGSRAIIPAAIDYKGPKEAVVQDGAQIGEINFERVERSGRDAGKALASIFTLSFVIKILGLIIIGLILLRLFPRTSRNAVMHVVRNPWSDLGIGFLFLIVVPLGAIISLITFVGMYVAIIAFLAYLLILVLASVVATIYAGTLLLNIMTKRTDWQIDWQALVIGTVALAIIGLIPLLGGLVFFVLLLMSAGALIRMLFGHIKQEQAENVPISPQI